MKTLLLTLLMQKLLYDCAQDSFTLNDKVRSENNWAKLLGNSGYGKNDSYA